jgi:hypothetical protein
MIRPTRAELPMIAATLAAATAPKPIPAQSMVEIYLQVLDALEAKIEASGYYEDTDFVPRSSED